MSITEIKFSIKEYKPIIFNFSDCCFQIYSQDTKFEKCIFYHQNNYVTDKTELKSDIKYFVKAMIEGEIFGIASFIIPRKIFYKKIKVFNINNLELTLSESILNKYFETPILKNPEFKLSISLQMNLNYIVKKVDFKKKIIKKKLPITQKHANSFSKFRKNKTSNVTICKSHNSKNNSFSNLMNYSYYKRKIPLTQRQNGPNTLNYSKTQSDISVIDSVLVDNDELSDENNDIKTKLNFNLEEYPSDSDIQNKIKTLSGNLFELIKEKNLKLQEYINCHIKLGKSFENYNKKIKVIMKKNNKLKLLKENNIFKNEIEVNSKDNYEKIYKQSIKNKKKEFEIIESIFKDNITYSFNSERIKNLLLKTIKCNLDLSIDLTEYFSDEGIQIFREICQKYGLITGNPNS